MIVLLNGPLGIGKSTLAEALGEAIDGCVTLFGDGLCAFNPTPVDEMAQTHATMALLIGHHRRQGYRHFVVEHYWPDAGTLADLHKRIEQAAPGEEMRCFLLTLPAEHNLARIRRRRGARAIGDETFEAETFARETRKLAAMPAGEVGEPFDVSDPPEVLVERLLRKLGFAEARDIG